MKAARMLRRPPDAGTLMHNGVFIRGKAGPAMPERIRRIAAAFAVLLPAAAPITEVLPQ
jgi:hypothetical protein